MIFELGKPLDWFDQHPIYSQFEPILELVDREVFDVELDQIYRV